ncbi:uncharacterized protein N7479_010797 [Penicillium vulpinum]|uniref:uncharacterized protein n=1 Tax=Penicillium vulpinum TaxID=29845 RepID=UPI002548F104|nr:uncharacterized protein N7479_010797 [Penicillium vulpinum]KAJ5952384.1 hypothetical protein N7479_010797 [Penicillium vulpinum]
MSTQRNKWKTELVGKKWMVGARDRSAPPEGGGAEIDHRTPQSRPRKASAPITVVPKDTETFPPRENDQMKV